MKYRSGHQASMAKIPKVLPARIGLMAAVLALAGCATGPAGTGTASQAPLAFTVKGLEEPAEVLVDRWGVPHMYAGTTYDAFVDTATASVAEAGAARRPVALLVADVDHYRRLAEEFGQPYAESVLRTIFDMARANLREGELVAHPGGDDQTALPGRPARLVHADHHPRAR